MILNQHIVPLDKGSAFALRAHFDNLDEDDLALLLYSLVLEPDVRHKLGYAKPAGLGSVQIEITRLTRSKMVDRYLGTAPEMFAGADLAAFIQQHIAPFQQNTTSITLQDLRRIWRWPPQGSFDYPSQAWFRDHPQAPISATH